MKGGRFLEHGETFIYFILYNRQRTRRSLTCHTGMSQCLTQKEPVRYTDKLIKKRQLIQNFREYLQLTKNLILVNITVNDRRGQERKGGQCVCVDSVCGVSETGLVTMTTSRLTSSQLMRSSRYVTD